MTIRRTLVCAFGASALWSLLIRVSGGFLIRLGSVRISSRRYETAFSVAVLCLAAAVTPIGRNGRRAVRDEWRWWRQRVLQPAVAPGLLLFRHAQRVLRPAIALSLRLLPYLPAAATLLLIGIVAAGVVVRWTPERSLWLDEEMIAINLRDRSFAQLAGTLWFGQSAAYGWLVAERAAMLIAGAHEPVLRLPPLLCFVALMVVAFVAGRRWLNAAGTFVFVACCGFSAWLVHYAFEVKPYTADALGALAVSLAAAWALDADSIRLRRKRAWIWWIAAAAALWFSYGALLAAPGCVVILLASTWRRDGWRAALGAATGGLMWLASFAICYALSLRFSLGSQYLYDYWKWAFPPPNPSLAGRLVWLGQQFKPLAENPASTTTGILVWLVFLAGLLTARRPRLALLAAAAPLTAFVLGWFRIVPLHDRVALWMTPHLYLGVALLADRATTWAGDVWRRRRWRVLPLAIAAGVACAWIVADLAEHRGRFLAPIELDSPTRGDGAAVRWLLAARAPGDVIVTTHMGWPAIWWYGGVSMADGSPAATGRLPGGTAALELSPQFNSGCGDDLAQTIARSRRTLIYIGFPDVPPDFLADLRQVLQHAGRTIEIASFDPGRVWIVEPRAAGQAPAEAAPGCLPVWPALRW